MDALLMIIAAFSGVPNYLRTGQGDVITRTTAGESYTLQFDVGALGLNTNEQRLEVMVAGNLS